jgi:hypothetical protein
MKKIDEHEDRKVKENEEKSKNKEAKREAVT